MCVTSPFPIGDTRRNWQARDVHAFCVVLVRIFDVFQLPFVLESLVGKRSGPAKIAIAGSARVDLVGREMAGPLRAPLPIGEFVGRSAALLPAARSSRRVVFASRRGSGDPLLALFLEGSVCCPDRNRMMRHLHEAHGVLDYAAFVAQLLFVHYFS
eukprot:5000480-Pleurochrysis_carterae.AAC.2